MDTVPDADRGDTQGVLPLFLASEVLERAIVFGAVESARANGSDDGLHPRALGVTVEGTFWKSSRPRFRDCVGEFLAFFHCIEPGLLPIEYASIGDVQPAEHAQ